MVTCLHFLPKNLLIILCEFSYRSQEKKTCDPTKALKLVVALCYQHASCLVNGVPPIDFIKSMGPPLPQTGCVVLLLDRLPPLPRPTYMWHNNGKTFLSTNCHADLAILTFFLAISLVDHLEHWADKSHKLTDVVLSRVVIIEPKVVSHYNAWILKYKSNFYFYISHV